MSILVTISFFLFLSFVSLYLCIRISLLLSSLIISFLLSNKNYFSISVEKSRTSKTNMDMPAKRGGRGRPRGGGSKVRGLKKEAQPENRCPTVKPNPRKEAVMEGSAKEEKEAGLFVCFCLLKYA